MIVRERKYLVEERKIPSRERKRKIPCREKAITLKVCSDG